MTRLSIILPVLNEGASITASLQALKALCAKSAVPVEILVVDGGSCDDTVVQATASGVRVIKAPPGRARQMNAGAAAASGDVLLFLHADTVLPANALAEIARGIASGRAGTHTWGRFDVHIDGASAWFPVIAALMNWRSRLTGIATGDQAIFVRREAFEAVGRFPDLPLMEDIALCSALRRHGRPFCSAAKVHTSGRRWEKHGVLRTILLMWRLRLRYFFGADPRQLAAEYGYGTVGIAILAKAPVPGFAKTRLIPLLGPEGAARLQGWLLRRTVATARAAKLGPVTLWCAPDTEHPAFLACVDRGTPNLRLQPDADLGQRMLRTVEEGAGMIGTLVIGTDCPALDATTLQAAAQVLRSGKDTVLIPAEDGGYVLIGLRQPRPEVFSEVHWGAATVMAETRQRLKSHGLSWAELPMLWDVDVPADYERLAREIPEVVAFLGGQ